MSGDHRRSLMTGAYAIVCSRWGNDTIVAITRGLGGRSSPFRKSDIAWSRKTVTSDSIWSDSRRPFVVTTTMYFPSGEHLATSLPGSPGSDDGSLNLTMAMSSLTENAWSGEIA